MTVGSSAAGRATVRPCLVLLGLCTALWTGTATAQSPPAAADRTTLTGLDGGQLTETELDEGVTILVVWATWSPRCRDVASRIEALAKTWEATARVASVVFQEEPQAIRRFLEVRALDGVETTAPVFIDTSGAFSKKHAVTTLPFLLVFDAGAAAYRGKLPADPDPVIERALADATRSRR